MIKKIDKKEEYEIFDFSCNDIYAIRIKALLKAYGTGYDFASFYCCYDDNNSKVAIISKLDNDFTVCHLDSLTDFEEISSFVNTIGYDSLLSDDSFELNNYIKVETGIVMASEKKVELNVPYAEIDDFPKLMDIYNLDDYDNWNFEAWYVDLNHRIRHNTAKAYALKVSGEIISSAVFSSIYSDKAILTSVHTDPAFRNIGYAGALVSHMIWDIKGKIYLMREKDKNESFYKKLGFENIGIWRLYK